LSDRVELQREIDADREAVFGLVATAEGLRRWLDEAELDARVGGAVRVRMRDAEAFGKVIALDPPQHISFSWQWADEAASSGVVAFDAIDHGARTHLTLRHVGLRSTAVVDQHAELWRYWLGRLIRAASSLPEKVETTHP
jgi:uncharacterized protein YndB with AHSA1/START domain